MTMERKYIQRKNNKQTNADYIFSKVQIMKKTHNTFKLCYYKKNN